MRSSDKTNSGSAAFALLALSRVFQVCSSARTSTCAKAGGSRTSAGAGSVPARRATGNTTRADLRAAADEGVKAVREQREREGGAEVERAEMDARRSREETKAAAQRVVETVVYGDPEGMSGVERGAAGCENCGGSGLEWSCAECGALGFLMMNREGAILDEEDAEDAIFRTCEVCRGQGKKQCDLCSPLREEDDTITRPFGNDEAAAASSV
jgi:hypothetical protein